MMQLDLGQWNIINNSRDIGNQMEQKRIELKNMVECRERVETRVQERRDRGDNKNCKGKLYNWD